MYQPTLNRNQLFAEALEIDVRRLVQLCSNHYSIWLLRRVWCYSDASASTRLLCLNLCYDLLHSGTRYFIGVDHIFLKHPHMLNESIRSYHEQYCRESRFFK